MPANQSFAARYPVLERLRDCIAALAEAFRTAKVLRETRRELHALSDHMLRDIGLRRDQIALLGRKDGPPIRFRR
jgi:uncharacterized protein YjiS (DUF1127 family)